MNADARVVLRAAARSLADQGDTPEQTEARAEAMATMILHGQLTLELREGLELEPPHNVGTWLVANFATGEEEYIHVDDLDLPPGVILPD